MKTIDITYKDFFRYLDFDNKVDEEQTKEIVDFDGDGSYYAIKPDGTYTTIQHIVKKPKQKYVKVNIVLPDNKEVSKYVSPKHIFISDGNNVYAEDSTGLNIDTISGSAYVSSVKDAGEDELYDISIESPHHYIDDYGIIHHNSFIGLKIAKNAQKMDDEFIVIYIDTEMAFDYEFSDSVGIDRDRLLVIQSNRLEDVQTQIMSLTKEFTAEERSKVLLIVDSWGGLVTSKTVTDAEAGKDVKDMTIAQKKNTLARLLTGIGITVFVINQVYACGTKLMTVKTEEGEKPLADILPGDMVQTTNGMEPVTKTFRYDNTPVYQVEMENGIKLEFSEDHKFLINHKGKNIWVTFTELSPGMDIISYDGKPVEIWEEMYSSVEDE